MFCEYAYYPNGDETKKLNCSNEQKLKEDKMFKDRCPLIYFCNVTERYENTTDMFNCFYRGKK